MKFHEAMIIPTLLYDSETWIAAKKDPSRIQAAEMQFSYLKRYIKGRNVPEITGSEMKQ